MLHRILSRSKIVSKIHRIRRSRGKRGCCLRSTGLQQTRNRDPGALSSSRWWLCVRGVGSALSRSCRLRSAETLISYACSLLFSTDYTDIVGSGCPPWASPRELPRPPLLPLFPPFPLFACDPLEDPVLLMFGTASLILSQSYLLEKRSL
jgi:hypothetical protein